MPKEKKKGFLSLFRKKTAKEQPVQPEAVRKNSFSDVITRPEIVYYTKPEDIKDTEVASEAKEKEVLTIEVRAEEKEAIVEEQKTKKKARAAPPPSQERAVDVEGITAPRKPPRDIKETKELSVEEKKAVIRKQLSKDSEEAMSRKSSSSSASRVVETNVLHYSPQTQHRNTPLSPEPPSEAPPVQRNSNIILNGTTKVKSIPVSCYDGRPKQMAPPPPKSSPVRAPPPPVQAPPTPANKAPPTAVTTPTKSPPPKKQNSLDSNRNSVPRLDGPPRAVHTIAKPPTKQEEDLVRRYDELKSKFDLWQMVQSTDKHSKEAKKLQMELIRDHDAVMDMLRTTAPDEAPSVLQKKRPSIAPDTYTPRLSMAATIRSPLTITASHSNNSISSSSPYSSSPGTSRSVTPKYTPSSACVSPAASIDSSDSGASKDRRAEYAQTDRRHLDENGNIPKASGVKKTPVDPVIQRQKAVDRIQEEARELLKKEQELKRASMPTMFISHSRENSFEPPKPNVPQHKATVAKTTQEVGYSKPALPTVTKKIYDEPAVNGSATVTRPVVSIGYASTVPQKSPTVPRKAYGSAYQSPTVGDSVTLARNSSVINGYAATVPQKSPTVGRKAPTVTNGYAATVSQKTSTVSNGYGTTVPQKSPTVSNGYGSTVPPKSPTVSNGYASTVPPKSPTVSNGYASTVPQKVSTVSNGYASTVPQKSPTVTKKIYATPSPTVTPTVTQKIYETPYRSPTVTPKLPTVTQTGTSPAKKSPVVTSSPQKSVSKTSEAPTPKLPYLNRPEEVIYKKTGSTLITVNAELNNNMAKIEAPKEKKHHSRSPKSGRKLEKREETKPKEEKPVTSKTEVTRGIKATIATSRVETREAPVEVKKEKEVFKKDTVSRNIADTVRKHVHTRPALDLSEMMTRVPLRKVSPPVERNGFAMGRVVDMPSTSYVSPQSVPPPSTPSSYTPYSPPPTAPPPPPPVVMPPPPPPPPPMSAPPPPPPPPSNLFSTPIYQAPPPVSRPSSIPMAPPPPPPLVSSQQLNDQKQRLRTPIFTGEKSASPLDLRDSLMAEIRNASGGRGLRKVNP